MIPYVSPRTGERLVVDGDALVSESDLVSESGESFAIVDGIPRFVTSDGYAAAFGLEWKIHSLTQLDSHTGTRISRDRLERCLGRPVEQLRGLSVLEAGGGAGRFTELLVDAGALVHTIDLSVAVEANRNNIGDRANYSIAQANLLEAPFADESFDVALCLGVLQHTPSPEESVRALWSKLKPGGQLVIDHYTWTLSLVTKLAPLYRFAFKGLEPARAKRWSDRLVRLFFPLHWAVRSFYPAQMLLSRISPCLVYFRAFPELSREQHYEFTRLDTFDHLTDAYKRLRTRGQIRKLLESLGAEDLWVERGGNGIEARCRKPSKPLDT